MIRVKDVRKSFGEKTVLKDINMDFEPGKCNMLIGASGSGKTVLMNIISGLVEPDSGEVWYGDREMTGVLVSSYASQPVPIVRRPSQSPVQLL